MELLVLFIVILAGIANILSFLWLILFGSKTFRQVLEDRRQGRPINSPMTSGNRNFIGYANLALTVILLVVVSFFFFQTKENLVPNSPGHGLTPNATLTSSNSNLPKVLYLENGSDNWNGWYGTSDWKVSNHTLLNDGTNFCCGTQPTITAPYQVQGTPNYAIEVRTQVTNYAKDYYPCFDITIRGFQLGDVWQGYKASVGCDGNVTIKVSTGTDAVLVHDRFNPGNAWHTYCFEARDTNIRLFVDGNLTLQTNDNRYLSGGQVGLKSFRTQLSVSSFKVINTCGV